MSRKDGCQQITKGWEWLGVKTDVSICVVAKEWIGLERIGSADDQRMHLSVD